MKVNCRKCKEEVMPALFPKIIPIPGGSISEDAYYPPRYTFMVKAICPICKRYIKFMKQDDMTAEELKRQLGFYEKKFIDGYFDK